MKAYPSDSRAETHLRHVAEIRAWDPATLPDWLSEQSYREKIQPRLAGLTVTAIAAAIEVSKPYATDIRAGRRVPHPRHWENLARLVEVSPTDS